MVVGLLALGFTLAASARARRHGLLIRAGTPRDRAIPVDENTRPRCRRRWLRTVETVVDHGKRRTSGWPAPVSTIDLRRAGAKPAFEDRRGSRENGSAQLCRPQQSVRERRARWAAPAFR